MRARETYTLLPTGACGEVVTKFITPRAPLEIVAQRAMFRLKGQLFDHLTDHDLAFHDEQTSGRLITRVQGDTEALRVLFAEVLLAFPADICLIIGMFVVMFIMLYILKSM